MKKVFMVASGFLAFLSMSIVANQKLSLAFEYPAAKATVHVVDDEGRPVAGAKVQASYIQNKVSGWGNVTITKDGITDSNGDFTESGFGCHSVGFFVQKSGYYPSGDGIELKTVDKAKDRWQPWNPTIEIVLKKKRNPVPMYAKKTDWIKVPVLGESVGYDLEAGDWVAPHGSGKEADFVITLLNDDRAFQDYDTRIVLKFTNKGDGIVKYMPDGNDKSYYKWPFDAQEVGYADSWVAEMHMRPDYSGWVSTINDSDWFMFRVRTVLDENGNIVSAKYGKMKGPINISPSGKISFVYYFNPDGTRNLEFDPKRNLFHWTGREGQWHQVKDP